MTCHEVQLNTSLYLYGELDFAPEEELERHVEECAFCQRMLDREKTWHSALKSGSDDVSLDLLSRCRRDLHASLPGASRRLAAASWGSDWWGRISSGFSLPRGSMKLAMASFIFFIGFGMARWTDRNGVPEALQSSGPFSASSLLGPSTTRVREIQPAAQDRVRIIVEQVRDGEVTGSVTDQDVLQLLLAATRDSADPGIRVDSVEMLNRQTLDQQALSGQDGNDIRDVLLNTVRHDPNAAVRLKALEGLRRFAGDSGVRETLKFALEKDENAGVRSEAIDILAPVDGKLQMTPDLAGTLQDLMRSLPDDDYVRARCQQVLRTTNAAFDVY
ncbi:MAG TPA: HEAT repeat domain-containing protein [Bryobacteraceae bacterium]|nr:HEAT repeat domain-containing protein [Bryobacteraceae bacterium]